VEVPKAGMYDVWFDWALPAERPENSFRLESDNAALATRIPETGSWDAYRQARLGTIALESGRRNILLRGQPPVNGWLLDLREIRLVPAGQPVPRDFTSPKKTSD